MKELLAAILVLSIVTIAVYANASSSFTCGGGVIVVGDSARVVRKKCKVIDKQTSEVSDNQYWTVGGKFKEEAVLTIRKGKVVEIEAEY